MKKYQIKYADKTITLSEKQFKLLLDYFHIMIVEGNETAKNHFKEIAINLIKEDIK